MGIRSGAAIVGGLVLLSAALLGPAHAQGLTTFGSESNIRGGAAGAFSFQSLGLTGAVGSADTTGYFSIASGSEVTFDYKVNDSYTGNPEFITSDASFSATAVGSAVLNSDGSYSQAVTGITGNFAAVTPDPSTGKTSVLSFAFATGVFNFQAGSGTATFSASASEPAGPPGLTDFSSSFLDFNNPNANGNYYQSEQFSLAVTGINGTAGGNGPTINSNNTINSFTGDQSGAFSSNPLPISGTTNYTASAYPEPSALVLTLVGGIGFLPKLRRRKRSKE